MGHIQHRLSFGLLAALLVLPATVESAPIGRPDPFDILVRASALNRLGFTEDADNLVNGSGLLEKDKCLEPAVCSLAALAASRSRSGRKAEWSDMPASRMDETAVDPALAGTLMFEKGRAALSATDREASGYDTLIKRFIKDFPDHPDVARARLLYGESLLADGRTTEAAVMADAVLTGDAGRGIKAMAMLLKARTMQGEEHASAMKKLFVEMPDTVAARQTGLTDAVLTAGELGRRADAFLSAFDHVGYQTTLKAMWDRGDRSPRLAYRIARSHLVLVRDDPQEALEMMLHARKNGVGTDPEGTFLLGRIYAKLEDYDAALKCFRDYVASGARQKRMLANYYLAWLPYDHQQYEKAIPQMDRFMGKFRKSDRYSYMVWFKGWSLYRMKRYREAIEVFEAMKKLGNCLVAGKAMYWGGMAWHRLGDQAKAAAWMNEVIGRYPLTWYSILAARRMQEWDNAPRPSWMTAPAALAGEPEPLWNPDWISRESAKDLATVRELSAAGRPREAWDVYRKIAESVEQGPTGAERARFMMTMADATEQYRRLLGRSRAVFGGRMGAVPTRETGLYWMTRYPRAYRALVAPAAGKFGIPELWVYSIMRQESRYDPRQVSHTAALGVMQMIVATARIVGTRVGVEWEADTFFEPGRNVLFGTRYLGDLYADFKGQIVFASAAYNTGAPAIRRFMLLNRGLPLDEMVEMIPYNEGRNYCRKVAEHLARYGAIYLEPQDRQKLYDRIFVDQVDYDLGTAVNY